LLCKRLRVSIEPRIIVIFGLPGAGKTTTAPLLAGGMVRAAHVEADRLEEMVVSGVLPVLEGYAPGR
jgi:predicted kinase